MVGKLRLAMIFVLVYCVMSQSGSAIMAIKYQIEQQYGDKSGQFQGVISTLVQDRSTVYFVKYCGHRIYRAQLSADNSVQVKLVANNQSQMQFSISSQLPILSSGVQKGNKNVRVRQNKRVNKVGYRQTVGTNKVNSNKRVQWVWNKGQQQKRGVQIQIQQKDSQQIQQKDSQQKQQKDSQQKQQKDGQQQQKVGIGIGYMGYQQMKGVVQQLMDQSDQRIQQIHQLNDINGDSQQRTVNDDDAIQTQIVAYQLVKEQTKRVQLIQYQAEILKQLMDECDQKLVDIIQQGNQDHVDPDQAKRIQKQLVDEQTRRAQLIQKQKDISKQLMDQCDQRLSNIIEQQRVTNSVDQQQEQEVQKQVVKEYGKKIQLIQQYQELLDWQMNESDVRLLELVYQRYSDGVDNRQKLELEKKMVREYINRIQLIKQGQERSKQLAEQFDKKMMGMVWQYSSDIVDMNKKQENQKQLIKEYGKRVLLIQYEQELKLMDPWYTKNMDYQYLEDVLDQWLVKSDERVRQMKGLGDIDRIGGQDLKLEKWLDEEQKRREQVMRLKQGLEGLDIEYIKDMNYWQMKQVLEQQMELSDKMVQMINEKQGIEGVSVQQKQELERQWVAENANRIQIQNLRKDLEEVVNQWYDSKLEKEVINKYLMG